MKTKTVGYRCCNSKRPVTFRDQSKNGVRVIVYVHDGGTTVNASCQCFGSTRRTHSNVNCPNTP